jgi:hypothetical protein
MRQSLWSQSGEITIPFISVYRYIFIVLGTLSNPSLTVGLYPPILKLICNTQILEEINCIGIGKKI